MSERTDWKPLEDKVEALIVIAVLLIIPHTINNNNEQRRLRTMLACGPVYRMVITC